MSSDIGAEPFTFGPWTASSTKGTILRQLFGNQGVEKPDTRFELESSYYYFSSSGYDRFESELNMKSLPDMIFANNSIKLKHENGFEIEFNAKDALNLCEKEKCPDILVQAADSWARV